jgi:hypothetical protein
VSISSIDTLDLFSAILSAVGGGGIGASVADSHLGSSLSKITVRFNPTASPKPKIYKYLDKKIRK